MAERRQFKMHAKLLLDVIQRQAGTLGKAILEGVMNAVDAKAKHCVIVLTETSVKIMDDGVGFSDRSKIEKFFEVFGQPHTADEEKTYGTFRMGRGQLFAFGANVWKSGKFEMRVDVKNLGLDYDLVTKQQTTKGCKIAVELYDKLLPSELADVEREVRQYVKWVSIPVVLNDEQISQDPSDAKWDYESENCYVRTKDSGGFAVFNLGVLVHEQPGKRFGVGGEAVSKNQMKVNFARNDVMSDCPVWKEMKKFIDKQAGREIRSKTTLDDNARQRLADEFRFGRLEHSELMDLRLFTDVSGRHWSARQLSAITYWAKTYTAAPSGDIIGDKVQQHKIAFVFAKRTLDRFGVTDAAQLMDLIRKKTPSYFQWNWQYQPFEEIRSSFNQTYRIINKEDWTKQELVAADLLQYMGYEFGIATCERKTARKIMIGDGPADGWTDGRSYIAISREWLAKLPLYEIRGLVDLVSLFTHEMCHDQSDQGTHEHSLEFYQNYHDHHALMSRLVEHAVNKLPKILKNTSRRLNKQVLKTQDKVQKLNDSVGQLQAARS